MKKMKTLIIAFLIGGLTLASCSSDEVEGVPASIEGRWNQSKTVTTVGTGNLETPYEANTTGCTKNYLEFAPGSVYNDVVYFRQGGQCQESSAAPGTWVKTDNMLTITNGGDLSGRYVIDRLTNVDLQISTTNTVGGVTTKSTVFMTRVR